MARTPPMVLLLCSSCFLSNRTNMYPSPEWFVAAVLREVPTLAERRPRHGEVDRTADGQQAAVSGRADPAVVHEWLVVEPVPKLGKVAGIKTDIGKNMLFTHSVL